MALRLFAVKGIEHLARGREGGGRERERERRKATWRDTLACQNTTPLNHRPHLKRLKGMLLTHIWRFNHFYVALACVPINAAICHISIHLLRNFQPTLRRY